MGFRSLFRRSEDLTKISTDLIKNKFVFGFVCLLALGNLIQFIYSGDIRLIGVFIVSGFLTSFFSQNMTVIMIISMVVANVCSIGTAEKVEGFKKKKPKKKEEKKAVVEEKKEEEEADLAAPDEAAAADETAADEAE